MSRGKYSNRAELTSVFEMSVANSIEENSRARVGARLRLMQRGAPVEQTRPGRRLQQRYP
jgi:hypothetical protein